MLKPTSAALSILALLLAGLAGVGGHEHLSETLRAEADCFVDHEAPHPDVEHDGTVPHFDPRGSKHDHHCVVCQQSRVRATAVAWQPASGELVLSGAASVSAGGHHGTQLLRALTARGPPNSSI